MKKNEKIEKITTSRKETIKYFDSIIEEELKDKYKTKISLKVKNLLFNKASAL